MRSIADALPALKKLSVLMLDNNDIGQDAAMALVCQLLKCPGLEQVSLEGTGISDGQAVQDALQDHVTDVFT